MAVRFTAILLAVVFVASAVNFSFAQTSWNAGVGDWIDSGNWTLGAPGAIADAQISNGGAAQILAPGALANNVTLGTSSFTNGSLDVLGGQAQFSSVLAVGASGNGALYIAGGGKVSNTNGRIGRDIGGTGTAIVFGPDSRWQNNGDLTVGSAAGGVGALTIENQASVHVENNLSISSASSVNLNGGTLRFNTVAGLNRLNFLSGTIQLAGNRALHSDPIFSQIFGDPNPPTPAVIPIGKHLIVEGSSSIKDFRTVSVLGGELTSQGLLEVGGTTTGVDLGGNLEIYDGGVVTVESSSQIEVSGKAVVSGPGARWNIGGNLGMATNFGFFVDLIVLAGGNVQIANDLALGQRARVNISDGTLRFNGFSTHPDASITFASGKIQLAGNRTLGADAAITAFFGAAPTFSTGKALVVEGNAAISAAAPVTFSGGALSAQTILFMPGSNISVTQPTAVSGPSLLLAGSIIDATGANLTLGDANKVNGFYGNGELAVGSSTVTLADKNDAVLDSATLVTLGGGGSAGALAAANGLTLNFGGNITGHGTIDTPDDRSRPYINNGNLIGDSLAQPLTLAGYVKGAGTFDNVNFSGGFSPGLSAAQVNLGSASYNGVLEIEIGGLQPGSGYDQLNHILGAGIAQLGGTLEVSLVGGFVPTVGQSFQIITGIGGVQNTFDDERLPSLGSGLSWNTVYGANSVLLNVVAGYTADFDHDGDVDSDDLTQWQGGFGENALSDADNDGDSDGADFLAWQRQVGSGPPATAASTPIPEPATIVLLTLGPAGLSGLNRAQKKFQQLDNA